MLKIVTSRLDVKIALIVSVFLTVVVIISAVYVYHEQAAFTKAQLLSKGKLLSIVGAGSVSRIMEEAIANGILSKEDVFDTYYELIPGYNPPKFHTRYDIYFDDAISRLQDEFLTDSTILYASTQDANGYVPTHNTRSRKPVTGNKEKNLISDNTKRIFNDPPSVKAAKTNEKGLLQIIQVDTGETVWDIAAPILVFNRHWGCFKLGFDVASIEDRLNRLFYLFLIGVSIFLVLSIGVIFYIINHSLKPLVKFSNMACNLADGDVDKKIETSRKDEIGKVADALERLRVSLKTAMERLMQKRAY